ncbi:FecR family protein [Parapedobacter koreensis]|uniref:FecR family protein n=1 Tax=Parapedobacter koreensis TaxID=332977 RepID=A0A1H7R3U6_9SPHI|nr:FecR family protein [Parapedobacter koreensis]SEL54792.1 FecR family protein [Parapedobacter koreensis]
MERKEANDLIRRYLRGDCTEEERQLLYLWLTKQVAQEEWAWQPGEEAEVERRLRFQLRNLLESPQSELTLSSRRTSFSLRALAGVAAVLLLSLAGLGIWYFPHPPIPTTGAVAIQQREPVSFQTHTALTIHADGKDYLIDSLPVGSETHIGQVVVKKTSANSLSYSGSLGDTALSPILAKHTLFVPKGRDFNITLPDGSDVWLNTESALEFPTRFTGGERRVTISGEAFFEVASDKKNPFIVAANDAEVIATGTQFNVKAYRDEKAMYATLVEGVITMATPGESLMMAPSQQAVSEVGVMGIQVHPINVANIIAKKNGYFAFYKQDITSIMKEVSRWYDVEVYFQGEVSLRLFGGTFSRKRTLSELLEYFESIGNFKFKQKGRRIIVMS